VIAQTVQLLEELDKSLNVLSGKLREWYGLHFPELDRIVGDHRTYAELISKFGSREGITTKELSAMKLRGKSNKIVSASENSMGAPLLPEDEEQMKRLAENLLSLYSYRAELERHISRVVEEVAPNLSKVAGPVLAAKLIEKSSGLRKLAMMPSSTVQVLGAEKALFRAKKTNAKPPKHGVIFQHPYIHTKPRRERGRAARNLASKLSLAARADAFSGNAIGNELRRELEEGC
jgi:nucleolar protein 56